MARALAPPGIVAKAYRYCRNLTRRSARNFYFAFLALPRQKRLAIYAVYAFCRACDDCADGVDTDHEKSAALNGYRNRLDSCFRGEPEGPVFTALWDSAQRFADRKSVV